MRTELGDEIVLYGESDGKRFPRTFSIKEKKESGASVICYTASHEGSGEGVLKEFYPKEAYSLERDEDGHPVLSDGFEDAAIRFRQLQEEYLKPYQILLDAKKADPDNELATFIPDFEIYYGAESESDQTGTVYIWLPRPEFETFSEICGEIHSSPEKNPEHKLVQVLSAVCTLTDCVCSLHKAGLLHLDIKPGNFGFVKRQGEALMQTLTMFDINSICSVYNIPKDILGSEGYIEKECAVEGVGNQTDIYAIGAVLFNAVIINKTAEENHYLYKDEFYDELKELVDTSRLIRASEANSHPRLRYYLTRILGKCLCRRAWRYKDCEELRSDLDDALYYALPSEIARKKLAGEKWKLVDAEKLLDKQSENNALKNIGFHLYDHPLYEAAGHNEKDLNVLVIGFGSYGQKFLDLSLQFGQIVGKTLNVTVISEDASDKALYLDDRPELSEFFNTDSSSAKDQDEESYGNIRFEVRKLSEDNSEENTAVLQDLICSHTETRRTPDYIFVAMGDDALNLQAAQACREASEVLDFSCSVSYVREKKTPRHAAARGIYPLYIKKDCRENPNYSEIERMAFNTHLVWEKGLNIERSIVRKRYLRPYNHDSCIFCALSLKYKLYSAGIDLSACGSEEAAGEFNRKVLDAGAQRRELRDRLIWIEHRRWVVEKLCAGWTAIRDLEECAGGETKDERRRRHVCIVRSRPEQILKEKFSANHFAKWDKPASTELAELDELERMSVLLHGVYMRQANAAKKKNLLTGSSIAEIRRLVEGNADGILAFEEWNLCLKDIWNGDHDKVRSYEGLKNALLKTVVKLSPEDGRALEEQIKAFDVLFFPIRASMEYRDYKQDDVALIDNIPFILSCTDSICMVVPFSTGNGSKVFSNLASGMVVNPERIIYLCYLEKEENLREIEEALPGLFELASKKKLRAAVEFVLAYDSQIIPAIGEDTIEEMNRLSGDRIRQIKTIPVSRLGKLAASMNQYLETRSAGRDVFAVEMNDTKLSSLLEAGGTCDRFAHYSFDPVSQKFHSTAGCDVFSYIGNRAFINVFDMAAFRQSTSLGSSQPEFFKDYRELWTKYRSGSGIWKILSFQLSNYTREHDVIAAFRKTQTASGDTEEYHFILPFKCSTAAKKIIAGLLEKGIAEQGSRVNIRTSDTCEVIIMDRRGFGSEYGRLFSNVYALMLPDCINVYLNAASHEVIVSFDDLNVSGLQIQSGKESELFELLEFFNQKGYVIDLYKDRNGVGFTYGSWQIKKLLTSAGRMLEIYTYHRARELDQFDDIVSSCEIDWADPEIVNELDCILISGFNMLFVECKASHIIEQKFYNKLSELVRRFGINAKGVLIADTEEKPSYDTVPGNMQQRSRGSKMDIITIWDRNEINNIGHTLLQVMNGDYKQKEWEKNV